MGAVIEVRNLSKRYGRLTAVADLSFEVEHGAIFGFVGPNGAGKTSTLRILTTLLRPDAGEAWVAGHAVTRAPRGVRRAVGYMPDFFGVYDDMRVWEYLDFFAACYGIAPAARTGLADDLLELVDLGHRRDDMVDGLSRGMKQRLCLARCLIHDPQVLILDEPASGLDPRARVEIRELMRELARMGKTIFFSTHILSDVAEICTHVGILEAGRLVASGTMEAMSQRLTPHRQLRIGLLGQVEQAEQLLATAPGVQRTARLGDRPGSGRWTLGVEFLGDDSTAGALLSRLVADGLPVVEFREESQDLEDVFLRATKGIVS